MSSTWKTEFREHTAVITNQLPTGTNCETPTFNVYTTVPLNTLETNIVGCTLTNNEFTLPKGAYRVLVQVPVVGDGQGKCRLYNVTDSSVVASGTVVYPKAELCDARVYADVTLGAQKTLRAELCVDSSDPAVCGRAFGKIGRLERYAMVAVKRLGA